MNQKTKTQELKRMKQFNDTYRIDTDQAWKMLHERLEKDQLLTGEPERSSDKKRILFFQRAAAVAAVCIGIIFAGIYFSHISHTKDNSLVFLENKDDSGTLVTTLEDGSTVYLTDHASISYPTVFAENQRNVELNGNALFCIAKDENRPFVVTTNGITIEVTGTVFAVQSSVDNPFELFVKQGKVNVHSKNDQAGVPVEAGETVQLTGNRLSKSEITNFRVFNRFSDKMCFKDEKLNNIVHAINTIYDSPTIVTEESLKDRTLTVTFDNNSVETMTELICLALNLEQIRKQDTIFIRPVLK
ncbi:MAG: FecR family protein [Candidatus Azobacteroides sp.]|nr:FecR family protein [Candidatus Azobacteroides sp.]